MRIEITKKKKKAAGENVSKKSTTFRLLLLFLFPIRYIFCCCTALAPLSLSAYICLYNHQTPSTTPLREPPFMKVTLQRKRMYRSANNSLSKKELPGPVSYIKRFSGSTESRLIDFVRLSFSSSLLCIPMEKINPLDTVGCCFFLAPRGCHHIPSYIPCVLNAAQILPPSPCVRCFISLDYH